MNLALFDFDHTITHTDSFAQFLKYSLSYRQQFMGGFRVAPWFLAFRVGYVSDQQIRMRLCRVAYKNYSVEKLVRQGQLFSKTILPTLLHEHAKQQITWHQQQGDQVVVVSSSLDVYLKDWCQQQGIDLICNQLEVRAGRYTGELYQGDCGYAEKARRVQQQYCLSDFELVYAYGDSPNDHAMLALADKKFYQWQEIKS
ncbi:HAD-IB family hydrolase [Acinetobacter brisouii]|uniref:HAD-IB family hydrolase n=1 Tax=Acinetobacter brisouii TaxID=396323 RepID=UPI0005F87ED6|nr:HAD-IB family hydrolase [Acinetobacter brisouii]KJV41076.1 hydrolase [Acinetobacter brisouii]